MSATKNEKLDSLFDDLSDLEYEVMTNIRYLIKAKWDSPTVKNDIEKLNKQRNKLWDEIELLEEREKKKK